MRPSSGRRKKRKTNSLPNTPVNLIIQPDDGLAPLLQAVRHVKNRIDILIFRFDRPELEKAIEAAVARGVVVRALIAHTNGGGGKNLRKLELRMLAAGVICARTADDLLRYHGKMMIVDDELFVLGFNLTKLDMEKSRSFGIVTKDPKLIKEASVLFEADCTRQPYTPTHDRLVVSPESSRKLLKEFIEGAKKQLLIYDAKISDRVMLKLLDARAKDGVEIRVLGKVSTGASGIDARKMPGLRLHVRAMVRDGTTAFVGSQSLRKLELDGRREVGVIVSDPAVAKRLQEVFESDWAKTLPKSEAAKLTDAEAVKTEKAAEKIAGEQLARPATRFSCAESLRNR
jgi:phosphatidylserine/phosphatidylglycerophosphate/cardiolipin synthase-like enzyme